MLMLNPLVGFGVAGGGSSIEILPFADVDIIPTMSSETTGICTISSPQGQRAAFTASWRVGDDTTSPWDAPGSVTAAQLNIVFSEDTYIYEYSVQAASAAEVPVSTPRDWTLYAGPDSSNLTLIHTVSGLSTWTGSQVRQYEIPTGPIVARHYRFEFTNGGGGFGNYLSVGEIQLLK